MNPDPTQVAVIGTGYVGLTAAACLAHLHHDVVGIDIDAAKVARLRTGDVPIVERGLPQLVERGLETGRLRFEDDHRHADAAIVLLCLPTPTAPTGDLDLRFVEAAARDLREVLRPGAVVVTKSTVPVGTHRLLEGWLDRPDVAVAANPEFLREGTAVHDFFHPDRVVVGAAEGAVAEQVAALYRGLEADVLLTDPASAEMIKFAANTFLAAKLSLVNEMSRLCDRVGADVDEVMRGVGGDHRIGSAFMRPGPGWGGSCFPKDTRGMRALAAHHDLSLPVVEATITSNEAHLVDLGDVVTATIDAPMPDATVAVWGASFKAGTDDCRESPALALTRRLVADGATVRLFDPAARPEIDGVTLAGDLYDACDGADLLLIATEWPEFAEADLDKVAGLLAVPQIVDTRCVIDPEHAAVAGLRLRRPGRPGR